MAGHASQSGLRVALLAGGDSAEREISRISGEQVQAALGRAGHNVTMFDPATREVEKIPWDEFDACFLALHGGAGEDGRIQRRLESLGVYFTGSGSAASRLAMCKSASKERFFQAGLPTLPYVLLHSADSPDEILERTGGLPAPLVVKPDSQGSSLGLGLAGCPEELCAAVDRALALDPFVLVEPCVVGREFTVAVLGRQALPVIEIVTPDGWFDYEAKYESAMTEHRFETGLTAEKTEQLERLAVEAVEALGASGLTRVDLIVDRRGRPWLLEVNTIPGLTPHSLAPKAAARHGMDLAMLCDWMLEDCLATSEANR
ncbi:MAG TPA: D-alanine--D-alanine ligase [Pirellulales bacterium]